MKPENEPLKGQQNFFLNKNVIEYLQDSMMRKQNEITSRLFMFFFLLFDCLIRAGGSEWVDWIFAGPIFLEDRHSYLCSTCPPKS